MCSVDLECVVNGKEERDEPGQRQFYRDLAVGGDEQECRLACARAVYVLCKVDIGSVEWRGQRAIADEDSDETESGMKGAHCDIQKPERPRCAGRERGQSESELSARLSHNNEQGARAERERALRSALAQ
jgi:hypothetical protein